MVLPIAQTKSFLPLTVGGAQLEAMKRRLADQIAVERRRGVAQFDAPCASDDEAETSAYLLNNGEVVYMPEEAKPNSLLLGMFISGQVVRCDRFVTVVYPIIGPATAPPDRIDPDAKAIYEALFPCR